MYGPVERRAQEGSRTADFIAPTIGATFMKLVRATDDVDDLNILLISRAKRHKKATKYILNIGAHIGFLLSAFCAILWRKFTVE
jgi:hypothetical protein